MNQVIQSFGQKASTKTNRAGFAPRVRPRCDISLFFKAGSEAKSVDNITHQPNSFHLIVQDLVSCGNGILMFSISVGDFHHFHDSCL